ncbi:isopentenyl phosphate kinase [Patescibacteria group bacterium]
MKSLILIKLGGSVITNKSKPFSARRKAIARLGRELQQIQGKYKGKILVGHGSGSFGHTVASKYKTQEGVINKNSVKGFCLTADAAIRINRIVIEEFLKLGIKAVSFAPLSFIYEGKVFFNNIKKALDIDTLPIIYGDVIMNKGKGFCIYSGEKTLDLLADKLSEYYKVEKIIMVGDTDGVYDLKGRTIKKISAKNSKEIRSALGGSKSTDVTRGMLHKVNQSLSLSREKNIITIIINGNRRNELVKAVIGQKTKGTILTY